MRRRAGFTLIELVVVVAIMAGVLALAAPKLLPVLMYSTHEGAARRLANYGTAAMAEAALQRKTLIFKFDFEKQEYWLEQLPEPPVSENEEERKKQEAKEAGVPEDDTKLEEMAQAEVAKELPTNGKRTEAGSKVLDQQAKRMLEKSRERERRVLGAQADRVKQDEKMLPESQQERNRKKKEDEDAKPEEVKSLLLSRQKLPEEVQLVLVELGGEEAKKGAGEFEITPTGIELEAKFYLMNTEGRTFVVTWDPVTNSTRFKEDAAS